MQQTKLRILLVLLTATAVTSALAQSRLPQEIEIVTTGNHTPMNLLRRQHEEIEIKIDGHIDEAIWAQIQPFNNLKVIEPDTLADAPYKTDMRMVYSERGIYVSFDMEQPADSIIQRFAPRDAFEVNRDNVGFTLDTSGDGRYGYWVNLSLGDSQMDGTVLPERQFSREWDGAWYGATQRTENGWSAEFYVPWSQMAMPKLDGTRRFGLYLSRKVAHLNERWAWPGLPESKPRFMSALQPIELEQVDPRQQWSLFPYASGTFDRVDEDNKLKGGLDLFWRPSSNFQLTATINPDFGAVESDNVVVNFTADETFFPEKRLFFQEGQEIFEISKRENNGGGMNPKPKVVNTRRIGGRPRDLDLPPGVTLSERDELIPADIIGAMKATGQIGSFRYGVLAAAEDDTDYIASDGLGYVQDGRDFGVFRILYEDSQGAAYRGLGWVSTLVAHPESDAVVHGADVHYLTTSGAWNLNGLLLYSDIDEDDTGSGTGTLADITYTPRQGIKHSLDMAFLDDKIDVNDLGFQRRNNIDSYIYRFEWIKSGLSRVRNFRLSPNVRYAENGEGFRVSSFVGSGGSITLNNLHNLGGFLGFAGSRYDDRNSFGNGTFKIDERVFLNVNYETDTSKDISFFGRLDRRGESLGGRALEGTLGVTWRPRHNLSFKLQVAHNDREGWLLHQEDENFTTFDATQWRPEFSFEIFPNARQQLRLAFQWVGIRAREDEFFTLPDGTTELIPGPKPPGPTDDFSVSQLNFQIRYRWQIAPLSDLFIVYTKGDSSDHDGLVEFDDLFQDSWDNPLGDMLVIKLRYRIGT
ncbi:MAG: hypothetical protein DRQ63_07705 [Gammaproteobacteria bacterium]|nr:MAG: hypothetical protein DRQ63_07705 [Gammaproteobacteria bacterium]